MSADNIHLNVEGISLSFGGILALNDISFKAREGQILAIIGPNGAGKTSLLNCLNNFYHAERGKILYNRRDLTKLPPYQIAKLGVARTFQHTALYTGLSTLDNLMAARHIHMRAGLLDSMLYYGRARREDIAHRQVVEEIIDFLEMEHIRKTVVGALPHGLRKRVDLGRALAMEPKLLLLDEPMTGMNLEEKEDMARFILDIHDRRSLTILLIEHDMGLVMDIADRVIVLDFGTKIAEGAPGEIQRNEAVINAYLGKVDA
ncbi:MAG: ABC transporter ATP-binding protein [Anaerolineae bacterium CG1_02_58_13]|nr:MAG: ABC transporter ATP-binding protein [Anaerolineae bacterium CG1_02_58_13]